MPPLADLDGFRAGPGTESGRIVPDASDVGIPVSGGEEFLPFALSGILVNGQSLSCGTLGVPVISTSQPYQNVQLHDSSGDYTDPDSGTWSMVPLIAPERADKWLNNQSNTSPYPTNVNGESPDVTMANALAAMTDEKLLTSNCGEGAASYTVIGKGGTGNAYQSLLNEATVAAALDPTYGVAFMTLTHGESDWGVAFYDRWLLLYQHVLETDALAITGQASAIPLVYNQMNTQPSAPQPTPYHQQLQAAISGVSVIKTEVGTLFAYDSGAASTGTLDADGYVETRIDNTAIITGRVLGLNHAFTGNTYDTTWDYALVFNANTSVLVYEGGALKGTFAANADGDIYRIEITGGDVTYVKNGVVFYTSVIAPTFPLFVQTTANIQWAGIYDLKLSSGEIGPWTHVSGSAITTDARKLLLSGPNYYLPFGDLLHLTASGYQQLGEQYARAAYKSLTPQGWKPLRPTNASIVGSVVTLTFDVPVAPLVFDSVETPPHQSGALSAWANGKGFEARSSSGTPIAITSVAIANGSQVVITCASPPETIAYANTADVVFGPTGGFPDGRCGLLKDSDPFVGPVTGIEQQNWCLQFSITGLSTGRWWFGEPAVIWTPASISNLGAWYRGDNIVVDGSTNVQTATDLGPNGYDATQASAGNRPAYHANGGLGYWDNIVSTSLVAVAEGHAQPFEVWAIVRPVSATPGSGGYIFDSTAGNETVLAQIATSGDVQVYAGLSFTDAQITVADHIVSGKFNGASSVAALDGATGTTGNCGAQALGAAWTIGNNGGGGLASGFIGRIYEVVVVIGELSSGDRASLKAYADARYTIP
jgi:hypothetical protein